MRRLPRGWDYRVVSLRILIGVRGVNRRGVCVLAASVELAFDDEFSRVQRVFGKTAFADLDIDTLGEMLAEVARLAKKGACRASFVEGDRTRRCSTQRHIR